MHSTYVKSEATIPIGGCKSSGVESTSSELITTPFCRKKLDFETDRMGKVGENAALVIKKSKKNTAIVTGTIQQPNFNGGDFASAASLTKNYRNQQQQPYGKIPSNSKRNARERRRVRTINDYFSQLQRYLPHSKPQINQSGSSGSSASVINTAKKMSKVETLKAAIEYIEYLLKYMPSNHQQVAPFSFSSSAAAPSKSQTSLSTPIASSTSSSPSSLSSSSPSSSLLSSPTSVSSSSSKIQQLNSTHMAEKLKTKVKSPVNGQLLTQTTLQPGSNMSNFNYVPQLNKSLESTPSKPTKIGTNFSLQQSENMTYDTTICSNVQQPVYNGNSQINSPSSSGYSNLNGQTLLANNPTTDFNHSNYNGNYNTMGGYNGQSYTYYGDQTQTYGDASQQYNQASSYSDSSNFSRVMMVDVHNQPAVNSTPVQYYNNTQTNAVYNNGSQSMSSFPANDYEMTVPPCVVQSSPDSMIHSQPTGYLTTTQARSPLTNVNHQYCSKPQSLPSLTQQQSSQHGQIDYKSELYLTRQEPNTNIY